MKRILCVMIMTLCVFLPLKVFAEEACLFFAPQSMNEENEIIIPVYTKNFPRDNDGLCGAEFQFAYDADKFILKTDGNGRPLLGTNSVMLVKNTNEINVSAEGNTVSVSYADFSGENNTVMRDGPLFYFMLVPKNPDELWNSDDYYPLRFIPDSVNLITLDRKNMTLSGIAVEGIDTYVGGYNVFPSFDFQHSENTVCFKIDTPAVYINGELKETDASPYEADEIMLPIRFLAEAAEMEIDWDGEYRMVSVYQPYTSVYFDMNSGDTYINAKRRTDLKKAEIRNDRTFIPLSSVRTIFGDLLTIKNDNGEILLNFIKNNEEEE